MINRAQRFWDKNAGKYDQSEKRFESLTGEIVAKTKRHLNSHDQVLDFGSATGSKTIELASSVKHIHGLDFSIEMIKQAEEKKNESNIVNISFSQGTIFDEDFDKASFDKIIAYAVVHLLEESEKSIQRIHELLKPGGLFISTTACLKEKMSFQSRLQFALIAFMKLLGIFPLHLDMYRSVDVETLIRNQNFQIIETGKMFQDLTVIFIVAQKQ